MKNLAFLLLALAACKSSNASSPANAAPCDPGATALEASLRADDKAIEGKTFAFKNCAFSSQGNDIVSFAATKAGNSIQCKMKDGEAGVKTFRRAAMNLDMDKLKLDVSGKVAKGDHGLEMTDCAISAHE